MRFVKFYHKATFPKARVPEGNLTLLDSFFDSLFNSTWSDPETDSEKKARSFKKDIENLKKLNNNGFSVLLRGRIPGHNARCVRDACCGFLRDYSPDEQRRALQELHIFMYDPAELIGDCASKRRKQTIRFKSRKRNKHLATKNGLWQIVEKNDLLKTVVAPNIAKWRKHTPTRTYQGKRKDGCALPPLIPDRYCVVKLTKMKDCRLSREVSTPIYTAPFLRKRTPLKLLRPLDNGVDGVIYFLMKKDNGNAYFSVSTQMNYCSGQAWNLLIRGGQRHKFRRF